MVAHTADMLPTALRSPATSPCDNGVNITYSKNSKISVFFLILLSNTCKMVIIETGIHKMLNIRNLNIEDPDQTASSEAVRSGSALFVKAFW